MNIFNINNCIINGRRIDMVGGRVIIDGTDVTGKVGKPEDGILEIRVVEGVIEELHSDVSVTCGNVRGSVRAGASVKAGTVGGSVSAGTAVKCGDVHGDASAGTSISCGQVGGSVSAGVSVRHG